MRLGRSQGVEPLLASEAEPRKTEKSRVSSGLDGLPAIQIRKQGCQARALMRVQGGGGKREAGKLPLVLPTSNFWDTSLVWLGS